LNYNKKFVSIEEDSLRFEIFSKNYDFISSYNKKNTGISVKLNHFADLTREEWKKTYFGYKQTDLNFLRHPVLVSDANVPTDVDWRGKADVGVKDQG